MRVILLYLILYFYNPLFLWMHTAYMYGENTGGWSQGTFVVYLCVERTSVNNVINRADSESPSVWVRSVSTSDWRYCGDREAAHPSSLLLLLLLTDNKHGHLDWLVFGMRRSPFTSLDRIPLFYIPPQKVLVIYIFTRFLSFLHSATTACANWNGLMASI